MVNLYVAALLYAAAPLRNEIKGTKTPVSTLALAQEVFSVGKHALIVRVGQ